MVKQTNNYYGQTWLLLAATLCLTIKYHEELVLAYLWQDSNTYFSYLSIPVLGAWCLLLSAFQENTSCHFSHSNVENKRDATGEL